METSEEQPFAVTISETKSSQTLGPSQGGETKRTFHGIAPETELKNDRVSLMTDGVRRTLRW